MTGLRRLVSVTVLISACGLAAVRASLFPDRYARSACTLRKELEQNCQVKSFLGVNETQGSYEGMLMFFGEGPCVVQIEQCYPNTCYSLRDLTYQLPSDFTVYGSQGFFKRFQILSGGRDVKQTPEGISFVATNDIVVVEYQTITCQEFFRYHGRVNYQLCNQPIEAITRIDTRAPNSLSC
ncbi:hypothetical protein HYH03_001452 [Edaphochlamys debaryana]|uniref:Uncharacterized protein n=1 Tax=Edaphochlamys debaryana TaxID=47281 RepID=A0A835YDP2_9CHLO|nr:hypothetical protein HYH03_001452 [Edaphochlamys debaryana]|eukprot:KAG2500686.1 hypothetical protein HYH03_001452 [Edaphochlamys debaryana]